MRTFKYQAKKSSFLYAFIAGLSFILVGCGGGSGSGSPQEESVTGGTNLVISSAGTSSSGTSSGSTTGQTTPSAPTNNVARTVDYYGDSTIWGYASGSGARVAVPAPTAFAQALPASLNITVRNEGVNSTDACQLLNGNDGRHPAWSQQMDNSPASIVIINHGINDEWRYDVNTYKGCLQSLAQIAKSKGKKVIFETPNPTRDSGPSGLDVYVNAMKAVASQQNVPVIDQYQYLNNYLNGQSVYTICPDGLHPTNAVYIMKGQYAASVFNTLGL